MYAILHGITDPYLNHAAEEIAAERYGECFMLWENTPAVLLGKHQNAQREINLSFTEKNNIAVVRRITGGGAVYNDSGNLNFTFIARAGGGFGRGLESFGKFTAPVLDALIKAGVPAVLSGRNDLTALDKKFSGNAQCRIGDKIIHHGTLLYDADLGALSKALTPDHVKFVGKGVKSVSARVANIAPYMKNIGGMAEFKEYLLQEISDSLGAKEQLFTESDYQAAEELAKRKYRTHGWNLGETRPFNMRREKKFFSGTVAAEIYVSGGVINEIVFSGDYFAEGESADISSLLKNTAYEKAAIKSVLDGIEVQRYFDGVSGEELISLII